MEHRILAGRDREPEWEAERDIRGFLFSATSVSLGAITWGFVLSFAVKLGARIFRASLAADRDAGVDRGGDALLRRAAAAPVAMRRNLARARGGCLSASVERLRIPVMAALTFELPAQKDQTSLNLRRWAELLADSELGRVLTRIEGRIETDRHGHVIIMSPPPGYTHGSYQYRIGSLLESFMEDGRVSTECPISTADGVKATDVAWISQSRLAKIGENVCLTKAPEICVEVLSPGNTRLEMREKKALYFAAGAREVWFCGDNGKMTFFSNATSGGERASKFCPQFPNPVQL